MNATRVSPLHDALADAQSARAQWSDVRNMAAPVQLDEAAKESDRAKVLALADASFLPRLVVKGPQAAAFLETQGIAIPSDILTVRPLEGDGLIARTGGSEFFLEDGVGGSFVERMEAALNAAPQGVYRVLRQDAALIIGGSRGGELFRHVCGYDFLTEPHHDLVFTQVAGISCSLLRRDYNGIPAFRLWTDGTYGIYIWRTLLEIAADLAGGPVGTAVFFPELREGRSS